MSRSKRSSSNSDWLPFLASWVKSPMQMGAVAPSSRTYCRMMVRNSTTQIDGPILELGPGLGVVTRTLLENGVAPERITSIEYERDFARKLQNRFPQVNVIQGDGIDLDKTLGPVDESPKYAAILFAIPIVNMPHAKRQALFARYFERLLPGGNLTQLSYMMTPPVRPVPGVFSVTSSRRVWRNIPPARVWIYHQDHNSAAGSAADGNAAA